MTPDRLREAQRIAGVTAARACKQCWWASFDDLKQHALLAVVEAERTFDDAVGVPFGGYAARAAHFAVDRYLWQQSAPVTGSSLRGLLRSPLEDTTVIIERDDDERIDRARWAERVRGAVEKALSRLGAERAQRTLRVLNGDGSQCVAEEACIPVACVYVETRDARELLAGSVELWQLWNELG
jgi:hypothetical protein